MHDIFDVVNEKFLMEDTVSSWIENIKKDKRFIKNPDGSYSSKDYYLTLSIPREFTKIPVKFKSIAGNFYCCFGKLESLENAPEVVGGTFTCHSNAVKFTLADIRKICKVGGVIRADDGDSDDDDDGDGDGIPYASSADGIYDMTGIAAMEIDSNTTGALAAGDFDSVSKKVKAFVEKYPNARLLAEDRSLEVFLLLSDEPKFLFNIEEPGPRSLGYGTHDQGTLLVLRQLPKDILIIGQDD